MQKDLFSKRSGYYAKYRPDYPRELFDYIISFVPHKEKAWDCGTGNGQAAKVLAEYFEKVDATDISEKQLDNAVKKSNIHYQLCSAEQTPFTNDSFNLITVAQAYHWFNWEAFHKEATRVGKQDCVVAIWSYGTLSTADKNIDRIIQHFYLDITGPYWDAARKFVDDRYTTVEFNFDPLPVKDFTIELNWNLDDLKGYFQSWSAVQTYVERNNSSPLLLIENDLNAAWPDEKKKRFTFPVFMRMGRIIK